MNVKSTRLRSLKTSRELYTMAAASWLTGCWSELSEGKDLHFLASCQRPVSQQSFRALETARASTPPAHDIAGTVAPFRAWRG